MRISKLVQADLALIMVTFVWGSTFTVVKQSLAQVSPILFIALRFWILGHILTVREWIGGMLVLAGILASELRMAPGSPSEN